MSSSHERSVALMKFLSKLARRLGVAEHVYVVGGAVRDFVLDRPIKDVDVVIDSVALGGKDSEWFAKQVVRAIPVQVNLTTNNYGVALLHVVGSWVYDGVDLQGEDIEIANARKESYGGAAGKGYKPHMVEPSTIDEDVARRELTYNTLMIRLLDLADGPDKKDIIDLTGCGLRDLQEGRMRCPAPPDKVFSDDPSRMIRVIKFALRYRHRLTPDTKAAIQRNASKIKNVPSSHLAQMLTNIVLKENTWQEALRMMEDLGLLEPIRELMLEDRSFRSTLEHYVKNQKMDMLFGLLDVGLPLNASLSFLSKPEQDRLREVTLGMDRDEAWGFLDMLKNPGRAYKDKRFAPSLAAQYGVRGKALARFMPLVMEVGRELLLKDPSLADNPSKLKLLIADRVGDKMSRMRGQFSGPRRAFSNRMAFEVYVDSRGMAHDDEGNTWPVTGWDEGTYFGNDARLIVKQAPHRRSRKPKLRTVPPMQYGTPEYDAWERRRNRLILAAYHAQDYRALRFLRGLMFSRGLTEKQLKWFESLERKYARTLAKMPADPLLIFGTDGSIWVQRLSGGERRGLEALFDLTDERNGVRLGIKRPTRPVSWKDQLAAIDELLAVQPSRFIQSLRDQVAQGRTLSDKQMKALRQNFYRAGMRDKADLFRTASAEDGKTTGDGTSVGLFIPIPEPLASQYPKKEEDKSPPHVTLLYVGEVPKEREDEFIRVLTLALGKEPGPIKAWTDGVDRFRQPSENRTVFYTPIRFSRDMGALRDRVWVALEEAGFEVQHGFPLAFFPHATLTYADGLDHEHGYVGDVPRGSWEFDSIPVWGLPKDYDIPLGQFGGM